MAYPRFCPEPKIIVLANYQIAYKDLEAEFSDCDYASGLSSSNRRHLVRYDKEASGFEKGKKDQFCIRTDRIEMASKNIFSMFFS